MTSNNISIGYSKRNNFKLFKNFEALGLTNVQTYNPHYDILFKLNDTNRGITSLEQSEYISELKNPTCLNPFSSNIICDAKFVPEKENRSRTGQIFIKYIPLINSLKYVCGSYNENKESLIALPCGSDDSTIHPKVLDTNNSAYVDSFFVYLSSLAYKQLGFVHGLDYYGSFLGIKQDFTFDILDDLDEALESTYFQNNKNTEIFSIDDYSDYFRSCVDSDSGAEKPPIKVMEIMSDIPDAIDLDLDLLSASGSESDLEIINNSSSVLLEEDVHLNAEAKSMHLLEEHEEDNSEISMTDEEWESVNNDDNRDSDSDSGFGSETVSCLSDSNDGVKVTIPKFPVNAVCMEQCEGTFEDLLSDNMSNEELIAALMQIIMTLLAFEKLFKLVHNDLHIGNVMWVPTSLQYLYYRYNNVFYKVPTFGRIFKIIDFGRSIYTIRGQRFCSDDFAQNADAFGQYNTEPYFNSDKPRIEPNHSFDLCRFACSILICLVDDLSEIPHVIKDLPAFSIISEWCNDDNGNNIYYKRNGQERYPGFKLYKMITRLVHNHTPEMQLERSEFKQFRVRKVMVSKVMNIDKFTAQ